MTRNSFDDDEEEEGRPKEWIRGVNIGGWLMAERFITPYLFAVNTCHLEGDMCWYPGQIGTTGESAGPDSSKYNTSNLCDPQKCRPVLPFRVMEGNADYHPRHAKPYMDYPIDEYTLGKTLLGNSLNVTLARRYMERHWDTF